MVGIKEGIVGGIEGCSVDDAKGDIVDGLP